MDSGVGILAMAALLVAAVLWYFLGGSSEPSPQQ